jgi:two-component system OmpR family response regulator
MPDPRLLVVEDDAELRSLLRRGLGEAGFQVQAAADGTEAVAAAAADPPDAIVMDIGLPDADGRDVMQALRATGCAAPVLFLTARDSLTDRLSGFHAGGDDYVVKPFHFDEVVVRLHALLRRSGSDASTTVGDLRLDPVTHALASGDHTVPLTPTEFRLLAAIVARPGHVVRRLELVRAAWPDGAIVHDNTLDQYVARLRRKLQEAQSDAAIATVRGVGYRFE